MDVSFTSYQHTPLSAAFYNFTYAHSSSEVSKIWYNFINLILDFEEGAAECDLANCDGDACTRHLTIIDQLYAYVNTSDDSLYGISTSEFNVRNGFKLLMKVFNKAGINQPIPPLVLWNTSYVEHQFLQHFVDADYAFLVAIPPNEGRPSWVKNMLHNGHPIVSKKQEMQQIFDAFYPKKKVLVSVDSDDEEEKKEEIEEAEEAESAAPEYEVVVSDTADIMVNGETHHVGMLCWLLVTLPALLEVRRKQKETLKKEFDKYEVTASNSILIDHMLDYLYWDERYIHEQLGKVHKVILDNRNELTLFHFIHNEFQGMVSMSMFMKGFLDFHMQSNRDVLSILFRGDQHKNNVFYFKLMKVMLRWNNMFSQIEQYAAFIFSKIVDWSSIPQPTFDIVLHSIVEFIERYISSKSMMMQMMKRYRSKQDKVMSQLLESNRQKTMDKMADFFVHIFKFLSSQKYVQQLVHQLGLLHFKYLNDEVESFTLDLFEKLVHEFEIDLVEFVMSPHVHNPKLLVVIHTEYILWLLCRCCFDSAIEILLFHGRNGTKREKQAMDLFKSLQVDGKCNNVFLCLAQSMYRVTKGKEMEQKRVAIFRMLVKYGADQKEDIKKALLQMDEVNGNGKNAMQYAMDNCQSLYNEMKQFMQSQ